MRCKHRGAIRHPRPRSDETGVAAHANVPTESESDRRIRGVGWLARM
jgi:hypothetical protein